jgi:hypothetical protein
MARERIVSDERRTSAPVSDGCGFRVCVVWAPGRENFTYHYLTSPHAAAHYLRLPGPTEGAMAALLQERQGDGEWEDWYHPEEGLELQECIEEGVVLPR